MEESFMDKLGKSFQEIYKDKEFMSRSAEKYLKKVDELDEARFKSWAGSFFAFIK